MPTGREEADRLIAKLKKQIAAAELTVLAIGNELGISVRLFSEDGSLRLIDSERDNTDNRAQRLAPWEEGGAVITPLGRSATVWNGGGV